MLAMMRGKLLSVSTRDIARSIELAMPLIPADITLPSAVPIAILAFERPLAAPSPILLPMVWPILLPVGDRSTLLRPLTMFFEKLLVLGYIDTYALPTS